LGPGTNDPLEGEDSDHRKNDEEAEPRSGFRIPGKFARPIPRLLYSTYAGRPFEHCTICGIPLATQSVYEINKAFHGRECVFEVAFCLGCEHELSKEFSEESLAAMKGFLIGRFQAAPLTDRCNFCGASRETFRDFLALGAATGRRSGVGLTAPEPNDLGTGVDARAPGHGIAHEYDTPDRGGSTRRLDARERTPEQSPARDQLLMPPIIMCDACQLYLNERISKKTRDIRDEFIRDNFPGVPTDLDLSPTFGGCL
jgi:hypothetical protein